ncbi:MAG: GspE/PulE family protein [Pirellulaceae bacterium]
MSSIAITNETLPLIVRLMESRRPIDPAALAAVRDTLTKEKTTLEELLIRRNLAGEQDIAAAYSDYYIIPLFAAEDKLEQGLADLLPEKLCRDHIIAPVAQNDKTLTVAFFTPKALLLVDELQLLTGLEVRPLFAALSVVEGLITLLYEGNEWSPASSSEDPDIEELDEALDDESDGNGDVGEVLHLDQPPPPGRDGRVIRYVNRILEQALRSRASDIHIEPFEGRCRVRLRIDGSLNEIAPPPLSMYMAIVSRIKVLSKMDIAEKRLPQDGAIALRIENRRVDMRVNTCPTVHGEKVVMRVLDKDAIPLELSGLGFDQRQEEDLSESIKVPHGLMLVTGPTGSGKSTTLYSCLNHLNGPDVNICTAEDPVEYKFVGINQVHMRSQIGLDFARTLRAFLRQDPDIIMVGEVRDSETAQICLRAALTGHFVLSTLHTNDALAAVPRLEDMEVEPFLLASTLRVVVAQRLLRRLCQNCMEPHALDDKTTERFGVPSEATLYRPRGCNECRETGYRGRVGAFEVIRINKRLADMIQVRASLPELRKAAIESGMKLLAHSAMDKACERLTSLQEAVSVAVLEEE